MHGRLMWKSLTAAATVCAICVAGWYLYDSGKKTVQQQWDKEKATTAQAVAKAQAQARATEQALQAKMDKIQKDKRNEIARLNRAHAAAVDGLRDRPQRPDGPAGAVPTASSNGDLGAGCTGRELYRPDAEFLVGEARRADLIRLQLAACQAAYQSLTP
jgi:hypothetical protein